jgi:hypothetical protein
MIGMLILDRARSQDERRTVLSDQPRQRQNIAGVYLEMGVAAQVQKLDSCAQGLGGRPGLAGSDCRCPVRRRLAPGADNQARPSSGCGLKRDDCPAPKLDIVGISCRQRGQCKMETHARRAPCWHFSGCRVGPGLVRPVDRITGHEGDLRCLGGVEVGLLASAAHVVRAADGRLHPEEP